MTSQDINTMRNRLKVQGVYARRIAASVVKLQSFRDNAIELLVGKAVGIEQSESYPEHAISEWRLPCRPSPAVVCESHLRPKSRDATGSPDECAVVVRSVITTSAPTTGVVREEAGGGGTLPLHRELTPFGAMRPDVSASRSPLFYHGGPY